ncbi:MAG: hypothetical protein LBL05_04075 [Synergistaceae bacterium]|nr:hypothetical protein [Synergistaceae bacterium]
MCKNADCPCRAKGFQLNDRILVYIDTLRAAYGRPIRVTSGWRCARHNAAVGGVDTSYHLIGRAVDISVENFAEVWALHQRFQTLYLMRISEAIYAPEKGYIHLAS